MMPLGQVAPMAMRQLAAWETIARDWPHYPDTLGNVRVQRCASCHIALWRDTDEHGYAYTYSDADRMAQTVAHLRQAHMDLDPDV